MSIIKFIVIMMSVIASINAKEPQLSNEFPIVNAYPSQYKGSRSLNENRAYLKDECFIKANAYIYDPNMQKNIQVRTGDANIKKTQKFVKGKSPDYENAVRALSDCVRRTNNPVAAWEGLHIINSYTGLDYKKNIDAYKLFSEILYADKSCSGYINKGDILSKGIAVKPDKAQAISVYQEGLKVCKNQWHQIVLKMKIEKAKR